MPTRAVRVSSLRRRGWSRVAAQRVAGGNLDQDDLDAVRVLDPHLGQAPGLGHRLPDDRNLGRGQPGVLGADVPDLDPDHHRALSRAIRMPGDLEEPLAEEEDHAGIFWRAELPVDRQAQDVAVETAAAVQVAGPHQDPAAQNVHATISPPRGVKQEAGENARRPKVDETLAAQLRLTSEGSLMPDSTQSSDGVITRPSSTSVAQTIDGLRRLMADRGFTVFNVIDHSGVAGRAGVQMPDSKLVMFGKPAVGAAAMVAAPLAALDIPLKVLVWEDRDGAVSVSYNSPGFLAGRHHLEGALRAPFDAVESIVEALPGA
jgi:uncharacterized protein (DUF302 family)